MAMKRSPPVRWQRVRRWLAIERHMDAFFALLERSKMGLRQLLDPWFAVRLARPNQKKKSYRPYSEQLEVRQAMATVGFSSSSGGIAENNEYGEIQVEVYVGGSHGTVTVDYATSDGTAIDGEDYTATSGSLTFASTEVSQYIYVPILDDDIFEDGEDDRTI